MVSSGGTGLSPSWTPSVLSNCTKACREGTIIKGGLGVTTIQKKSNARVRVRQIINPQ